MARLKLSKRDRLHQAERYLIWRWGLPFNLRVERKMPSGYEDCEGCCHPPEGNSEPLVRVLRTPSLSASIGTLLHEFAHVLALARDPAHLVRQSETEGHDHLFYRCLREVENDWHYFEGDFFSEDF